MHVKSLKKKKKTGRCDRGYQKWKERQLSSTTKEARVAQWLARQTFKTKVSECCEFESRHGRLSFFMPLGLIVEILWRCCGCQGGRTQTVMETLCFVWSPGKGASCEVSLSGWDDVGFIFMLQKVPRARDMTTTTPPEIRVTCQNKEYYLSITQVFCCIRNMSCCKRYALALFPVTSSWLPDEQFQCC